VVGWSPSLFASEIKASSIVAEQVTSLPITERSGQMSQSRVASGFGAAFLAFLTVSAVVARDDPPKSDLQSDHWKEVASKYRISLDSVRPVPLTFHDEPALKWTNPERKTDDGAVFVWTDRGRAEVAASFYRYKSEGLFRDDHEFISLSASPLSAKLDGAKVWSVAAGNVRPVPIPDAPKPASTPNERLRQMRSLAREFKATFNCPPDLSEIRLLTQPIYRFETEGKRTDVIDGALFAYVHTTDPEVLLTIEARPEVDGGPIVWQYSLARMSMVTMRVHRKDREVWSTDWASNLHDPSKPYMVRTLPSAR
jgi:hypothetical protein